MASTLLEPGAVVRRRSTDVAAVDDPHLASTLRYLREHALEPIGIEDVLDASPVSRRQLERWCRDHLDRSPLQEIRRLRIEHARRLLDDTDLPISQIANRCCFSSGEQFARVFKRSVDQTPTQYRRRGQYVKG